MNSNDPRTIMQRWTRRGLLTPQMEPQPADAPIQWGPLSGARPKGERVAAQVNRLRETPRGEFSIDFGGAIGRAKVLRNGNAVTLRFPFGTIASGTLVDVPGRSEVRFENLRFSSRLGQFTSAPTQLRVYSDRDGRVMSQIDRSLVLGDGRLVNIQKTYRGIFPLDE